MRAHVTLLAMFGLLATSCAGTDEVIGPDSSIAEPVGSTTTARASNDSTDWTVLVYSMADTDLEPFMMDDVTEMGVVGSGEGLDIVALVDRASGYSDDPVLGLDPWEGAKLLHIGDGEAEVLTDVGDINTGDPQVLADFVAEGIERYPASNYALVISDHGAAWPGVGGDESSDHDILDLTELRDAISNGLEQAGVERLDLLGFDACLMATYEVASTLAPFARRLLSSQELEPGHGWDYRSLQVLRDDPTTDVDTLGRALVDGFRGQAIAEQTDTEITLSLVDLERLPELTAALTAFTEALTPRAGALGPIIGRNRANVLSFGRQPDPTEDTHMVDLGTLVAEIGNDALDVSSEADDVLRVINDIVIESVTGPATKDATGLAIYFPPQQDWFSADYNSIEAADDWASFLAAYYAGGSAIPDDEQAAFDGDVLEVSFDDDGLTVTAALGANAAANVVDATIEYGIVDDDGSIVLLGREPAFLAEDGSGLVQGLFDLTTLVISDGEDRADAYIDITFDDEGLLTIDVPMLYFPPGSNDGDAQEVLLSLVLDDEFDLLSETYYVYDEQLGTFGELTADPAGIIVPEVLVIGTDGEPTWVATTEIGLFANLPDLQYLFEALASGTTLYVELAVTDFGGNTNSIATTVDIP